MSIKVNWPEDILIFSIHIHTYTETHIYTHMCIHRHPFQVFLNFPFL